MSAAVAAADWTVTGPGLVAGMPDAVYHRDPVVGGSLSHSGAKRILRPGSPAQFAYEREHVPADKPVFSFGRAAHRTVLGVGVDLVEVKADNWMTKKAKAARALAEFEGKTALLSKDMRVVEDMAEALAANTLAVDLLTRAGQKEVSAFAPDERDGVMLRCRFDHLPDPVGGKTIAVDYKTSDTADPDKFARAAWDYRYFQQEPWYCDVLRALGFADDVRFLFLVQAKEPPYLSYLAQLPPEAVAYGRAKNREAIAAYARCVADDDWPGPPTDDVVQLQMPYWANRELEAYL